MIWVIGSTGMLGAQVCRVLDKEKMRFVATSSDVDARDYKALKDFVSKWETENYLSAHKKDGARAKIYLLKEGYFSGILHRNRIEISVICIRSSGK